MKSQKNENLPDPKEPPGSERKEPWKNISDEDWFNWKWQLSHSLSSTEDFASVLKLSTAEQQALGSPGGFRTGVSPYFASLIDPRDEDCPIRKQVIPTIAEKQVALDEMADSLSEDAHSPVPGLIHRYPDRVLMLVNTQCAGYCRFCTRSRLVGDPHHQYGQRTYQSQIDYIAANPVIRDVLLSGGDPLILPQRVLENILIGLREIPHVEVIRIGTRVPIFLPMRVDQELSDMLRKYHPLWINVHVNHPKEITQESREAFSRLADAGIPLGSQTVLLAGINDCPQVMKKLFQKLVQTRVRPYYLYQCDQVPGSSHFRTSIGAGLEIMENLRGHTSGFAIPTYVIDAPEGGGKVPLLPQYLLNFSENTAVIRNFEGLITAYHQPEAYQSHKRYTCPECLAGSQSGQAGVSALLSRDHRSIIPENWQTSHQRSIPLPDDLQPELLLSVPRQPIHQKKIQSGTNHAQNSRRK